jgi:hypothetical protein
MGRDVLAALRLHVVPARIGEDLVHHDPVGLRERVLARPYAQSRGREVGDRPVIALVQRHLDLPGAVDRVAEDPQPPLVRPLDVGGGGDPGMGEDAHRPAREPVQRGVVQHPAAGQHRELHLRRARPGGEQRGRESGDRERGGRERGETATHGGSFRS